METLPDNETTGVWLRMGELDGLWLTVCVICTVGVIVGLAVLDMDGVCVSVVKTLPDNETTGVWLRMGELDGL